MAPACQRIADMLSEFLDGELAASERREVTLHLESCPACTRFAAELAATIGALHGLRRGGASRGSPRPAATPWR
ncbi:MAG: putative zinc-finger, partial [Anaeromyxobacteraceae bacterium]|nr:putative zinc-finger [Anaeromyxobacteraceae bacterium]